MFQHVLNELLEWEIPDDEIRSGQIIVGVFSYLQRIGVMCP